MNTIFIVGSSSGIGKATARLFAEKGWTVIATMRTPEKETELTGYPNVHLFPLDVTKPEQIETTVSAVLKEHDVDVLFNNAGYGMKTRFEDMTEEAMQRSLNTNLLGMILTTTSLAGEMGLVLDGIYAADKWAVTGVCEMLYHELYPFGIQVKTIVPGVVKTGFKMEMSEMPGYDDLIKKQTDLLMPDMDSMETPEEVAQDIYTAVTDGDADRMCYVTGAITKTLYAKRQELGDEGFRKYMRGLLN